MEEKGKDGSQRDSAFDLTTPFGSLKRSATNPVTADTSSPTSTPWPTVSHSSTFSPMGAFGSFSLGPISSQPGSAEKKTSFGSLRGESRFKNLLSKDSSEDIGSSSREKPSAPSLERLPETEVPSSQTPFGEGLKTRTTRSETNPFADEPRSGSAALGGQDLNPPVSGIDQFGLAPFGGLGSNTSNIRDILTNQQDASSRTPSRVRRHEPMSPTNTNPYQSPQGEKVDADDVDTDGSDIQAHLPNLNEFQEDTGMGAFGPIRRTGSGLDTSVGDRSQTSSVGANRGFPGLGGLSGLSGGWPTTGSTGTPTRERSGFSGFGDPIFGSMGDLQSPSMSTLGGGGFFGSHTPSAVNPGRPSKMGSLFPPMMQEQMRGENARQDSPVNDGTIRPSVEGQGRNVAVGSPQEAQRRETDQSAGSLFSGLGGFDIGSRVMRGEDSFLPDSHSDPLKQPANAGAPQVPVTAVGQPPSMGSSLDGIPQSGQNLAQASGTPKQLPTSQQRQMVMPDRMRWIYRDPQGNTQGPWSGLEMHDWFKAGFFTAELQVKKLEDAEYEPLAQLVRRIGNSREPFLVPQIGVPHGPEPHQPGGWGAGAPSQTGVVQPPFPSSFPNFGTTLSADQQNALERRKQEEQYLMARQKEHLAQQQVLMKQMQLQNVSHPVHPHPLQHHSSAHSLHSQPSFSSVTSPGGYQPSPIQGPIQPPQAVPGFFEPAMRQPPVPGLSPQGHPPDPMGSQTELPNLLDRLNINRNAQFPFGTGPSFGARQQENSIHSQQVNSMLQDRARLQQEQEQYDQSNKNDSIFDQQARDERLRQFHALRRQTDDDSATRKTEGLPTHPPAMPPAEESKPQEEISAGASGDSQREQTQAQEQEAPLSLSQQVQKAASAQRQQKLQAQVSESQTESPWGKSESAMPQPFPPPPSASPLPAPAAQRSRQNVADTLTANSRSQSQTPIETPTTSIAPWAKETSEAPKGPSLKEIQEAEARKAAKLEEVAAAARRALVEQERANQPPPPAPGLPSTANWASAASPVNNSSASGSPWNKNGKSQQGAAATPAKKTLAQIQKEEEVRKQRLAATNNAQATVSSPNPPSTGKRYADLASKVAQPTTTSGGAWTTVGAGGKPKASPAPPAAPRAVSGNVAAAAKPKTTPTSRPSALASTPTTNPNRPIEELSKWAKMALGKGLNSSINGRF